MPLMIGRIKRERTLKGLARKLFNIQGRNASQQLSLAQDALLRANPRLATPAGFKRGATILVPDIPGLTPTDRVEGKDSGSDGAVLSQLEERLQALSQESESKLKAANANAKQASKDLQSSPIQKAILAAAPDLKQQLPQIQEKAKARVGEVEQRSAAVQEVMAKAIQDLGSLKGKLG